METWLTNEKFRFFLTFRLALTWGKWRKEMWRSNFGILEANLVSDPCGRGIAGEFLQSCKGKIQIPFSHFCFYFFSFRRIRFPCSFSLLLVTSLYFRQHLENIAFSFYFFSYVVDAADSDNLPISKNELHDLLSRPSLKGIPLLVLGNKLDRPEAIKKDEFIQSM